MRRYLSFFFNLSPISLWSATELLLFGIKLYGMNYFHEFQKILPIKWEKKATNLILMANYEIFMIKKAHMYMK